MSLVLRADWKALHDALAEFPGVLQEIGKPVPPPSAVLEAVRLEPGILGNATVWLRWTDTRYGEVMFLSHLLGSALLETQLPDKGYSDEILARRAFPLEGANVVDGVLELRSTLAAHFDDPSPPRRF